MTTCFRLLRHLVLALLLPALGGCYYFAAGAVLGAGLGAASTPRPLPTSSTYPPGAALYLDFATPRHVTVILPGERDTLRVDDVRRVIGTLHSSRADTLFIAITELRRAQGPPHAFAARNAPVLPIPPSMPARVHVIAKNGAVAQRAIVGGIVGFALSYLLLIAACNSGGCWGGT
jgi:hypothetical protein